jgi:bacterioferritin-associated ferredoxin
MYVCVCNAVTESQVLRAAQEGVRNLRGLQARLGIALECGRCAGYAHGLLKGTQTPGTQPPRPRCNKDCGHCPNAKEKKQ